MSEVYTTTDLDSTEFLDEADYLRDPRTAFKYDRRAFDRAMGYKTPHPWRPRGASQDVWWWLCTQREAGLTWNEKYILSKATSLWFAKKIRPTNIQLKRVTGMRVATIRETIASLIGRGLFDNNKRRRPLYVESVYMPRKRFKVEKWWKGVHSRKVIPSVDDKTDLILSLITYQTAKRKSVSTRYLDILTGLPRRRIQRHTKELLASRKLRREADESLTAIIQYEDKTLTVSEMNNRQILSMLAGCYDMEIKKQLAAYGIDSIARFQKFHKIASTEGATNWNYLLNMLRKAKDY